MDVEWVTKYWCLWQIVHFSWWLIWNLTAWLDFVTLKLVWVNSRMGKFWKNPALITKSSRIFPLKQLLFLDCLSYVDGWWLIWKLTCMVNFCVVKQEVLNQGIVFVQILASACKMSNRQTWINVQLRILPTWKHAPKKYSKNSLPCLFVTIFMARAEFFQDWLPLELTHPRFRVKKFSHKCQLSYETSTIPIGQLVQAQELFQWENPWTFCCPGWVFSRLTPPRIDPP